MKLKFKKQNDVVSIYLDVICIGEILITDNVETIKLMYPISRFYFNIINDFVYEQNIQEMPDEFITYRNYKS